MSKKVKDALFELVQSLTKSEKRYFKLMSSRHTIGEENNYITLFDYLSKLDEYDEDVLMEHFKGMAFLNRFSITKKRLYDHILNSLDSYYSSSSIEAQLYRQLHSAEILYKKSLYDQCRRILRSAEKVAIKHERYNILLEISTKQKMLFENKGYKQIDQNDLDEIQANDLNYIQSVQNFTELWHFKSKVFLELSRSGVSRTEEQLNYFNALIEQVDNQFADKPLSNDSTYLYHHLKSAYYFAVNDDEKCSIHLKANLDLFENHQDYLISHPNSYFSVLTNAIYIEEKLGNSIEANRLLQQLKLFPEKYKIEVNEDFSIKLFSSSSSIELSMFIRRGDFEKAKKLNHVVENGLKLYDHKISSARRAFLLFKLASVEMGLGNLSESLKYVNQILNDANLDQSEDIIGFTHILDLLIHFELKHTQLLPYAIKSTQRFLKSRGRLHQFEKLVLKAITKLMKEDSVFEHETLWEELYAEMLTIKDDVYQGIALEYFDFESWAKSKAKRLDFEDVVKNKYRESTRKVA